MTIDNYVTYGHQREMYGHAFLMNITKKLMTTENYCFL